MIKVPSVRIWKSDGLGCIINHDIKNYCNLKFKNIKLSQYIIN